LGYEFETERLGRVVEGTFEPHLVLSPVTGEVIGHWRDMPLSEVSDRTAVLAGRMTARHRAQLGRARLERCDRLDGAAAWLDERIDQFVDDLVIEHGKPQDEARTEIAEAAKQIRQVAAFARSFGSDVPPVADPAKRILLMREPIGVIGVITPWNYPLFIPVEYLAPALAMGNPVVWKPAESTPLSNANLLAAFREAGFSEDELTQLIGGPETGRALVECDHLAALGFTGSSEVGTEIAQAFKGRPLLTELGGNGPTIVFSDADIEAAAEAIALASFGCSGQSCAATERILVESSIADAFGEAIVRAARTYTLGDPRNPTTRLGPLHLRATADKVQRHVADAVSQGAVVLCGGARAVGYPTTQYWPATVLTGVVPESELFVEETFGPVAPITSFEDEAEALTLALHGSWGLCAAVFTKDLSRAHRVADGLPHGVVVVNDHSDYWEPSLPVGGGPGTQSGSGRLGIDNALRFTSTTKVVAMDVG
jgi:acyl-CoA reductase-like NAD-dependent aldehyde dehydrogenase